MIDVQYRGGVLLPEIGLWLDPGRPQALAFVSHAHSDHTGLHRETILSKTTARLMQARIGRGDGVLHELEFREPLQLPGFEIFLIPAGHVLGSAQCWIRTDAGTLLYTGDFKLRHGLSAEPCESEPAETLIMETTFGLPRYVFPPAEQVIADVVRFCVETLEDEMTPVLLGYSLGKAQEILAALNGAGLETVLHGAVWKMTEIYADLGVRFPPYAKYGGVPHGGKVLVCPPGVSGSAMLRKIGPRRVASLSGWAMDPGAIHRMRCDAVFPLSDHADYPALLRHVEAVRPRRVLTLHGFAKEFARDLRQRGIEAWALTGDDQLELPLHTPPGPGSRIRRAGSCERADADDDTGIGRFVRVLGEIERSTGRLAKVGILSAYFRELDDADLARAAVWLTGSAFSASDSRSLQTGWGVIRRALLTVSRLSPSDISAISRRHNDAGATTFEVLRDVGGRLNPSLAGIEEFFDALAGARGPTVKTARLEALFSGLPAAASRGVVKILTGDLRIGLKTGLVEDAIAEAFHVPSASVREANMLLADLGQTAVRARAGSLDSVELSPLRPVGCMLASPEPDAEAVWNRFAAMPEFGGRVWLEDKLDGIRAQVHVCNGEVEIYSRDLNSIRETFPEIAADALAANSNFVLDGEILAWADGRALDFTELQKRLGRRQRDFFMQDDIPVVFHAFDLLWGDDRSLIREPLSVRRTLLDALPLGGRLGVTPVLTARTIEEIDAAFVEARARGNEGLIAKDPASPYAVGRRGLAWIKLKKEFATLDVVVVAAEYGHGRRSRVMSDYTFAVADGRGGLATIGKAYSGLTDAEIAGLTRHFQRTTTRQSGRLFEVEPTVVLEIAFDSLQESARHSSGLAMRFPRIKSIRHDKSPADIDSIQSARRLLKR